MGEAKKRGTFEERVQQAQEREQQELQAGKVPHRIAKQNAAINRIRAASAIAGPLAMAMAMQAQARNAHSAQSIVKPPETLEDLANL